MRIDPKRVALEYYFGDLSYWKLPGIAADALEEGYDGPALRKLAGMSSLSTGELRAESFQSDDVDSAFREMGVDAPIARQEAQLSLAADSAKMALDGQSSVFDEAAHIRIHLCRMSDPPEELRRIVSLSEVASKAPRAKWGRMEGDLKDAFAELLARER